MIAETLIWIAYAIFTAWLSARKDSFFKPRTSQGKERMAEMKKKKYKSLEEQMMYVRDRANSGQDYINVATGIVGYVIIFFFIIYPNINTFYVGLSIAFVVALLFAFISSKYIHPPEFFDYQFVTSFLNYLYISIFLVYIKFFNTIHPLLLLVLSIAIMYGYGIMEAKYGRDNKNR